jgi:hypothetical protein
MTPQTVIAAVRVSIKDNDSESANYRYSDDELLGKVNQAIKRMALLRPDLFTEIGNVECSNDDTLQQVPGLGRIIEVFNVVGSGGAVIECSRESMDQNNPTWRMDTAAPALNWMRHARNPAQFFIYPKAPMEQVLFCEYTISPEAAALPDELPLADEYFPVLVDITVACVEWDDDEHATSQKADAFYNRAKEALGITLQMRGLLDTEDDAARGNANG